MILKRFPQYEIFENGSIFRFGRQLKTRINNCGYLIVWLYNNKKRHQEFVHKLLLETFKINPDPSFNQGNHINGIKTDNSLDNLEWCNNSMNQKHAYKLRLRKPTGCIDELQSKVIRECRKEGIKSVDLQKYFKVSKVTITYNTFKTKKITNYV